MKKIITHPGTAHRDDILAVALLLAAHGGRAPIYRMEATQEDLEDPNVAVIDTGGRHEPELMNFDHHQFPRDAEPQCALTLVLKHLLIYEAALDFWPWLRATEVADTRGHRGLCEHLGLPAHTDVPKQLYSPFDLFAKQLVSEQGVIELGSFAHTYLVNLGQSLYADLREMRQRQSRLSKELQTRDVAGFLVADIRSIPGNARPVMGLEHFLKKHRIEADITITSDDRSPGFVLFRRDRATNKIDFKKVRTHPSVLFAHEGGFVVKLLPTTTESMVEEIITAARTK